MTARVEVEDASGGPARSPAGPVLVDDGHDQAVRWRPGERLQRLFEERCDSLRAAGQGDRLAVDAGELALTFDQLDARANRLARRLLAAGARPGDRVGLLFDQGVHAYVGMLAVLKVHAAYVPLDPGFPADRLAYIVQDAEVGLVLSQAHLREHLAEVPAAVLCVDEPDRAGAGDDRRLTAEETGEPTDDLCYIIYTSGSTGRPKGVAVEHASICNFVRVAVEVYGVEPSDRVYQGMTIAFDFSVEEIWVPLLAGATLVPKPGGTSLLGRDLEEFLRSRAVTALCCVPTLLATLDEDLPELRFLLVSGEACPPDLIARWHRPGRRFLNVYGPTEATVTATWTPVDPDGPVTIGVPLPTYSVVVLDPAEERALAFGEVGEIGIAGIGLARGYVHRDDLTERAFLRDFLGMPNNPSGRIYRTGDLGRVNDRGQIEYHGRIDTQVKVRGYRIELAEIEAVLRQVPEIAEAVVDTHEPEPGEVELVAWYSPRAGAAVDPQQVLGRLREHLPGYMVPAYLEELAVIPRLPSDKVDRKRLPPPSGRRSLADGQHYVAPGSATERALAEALAEVVRLDRVSVDSHFFTDLGANSLLLARFCARVRQRGDLPSPSMREVYLHPTVRDLAAAVGDAGPADAGSPAPAMAAASTPRYLLCGALQLLAGLASVYLGALVLVGGFRWLLASDGWADLYLRSLAFTCGSFAVWAALPVAAKWILIGRWARQEFPVWSLAYVRFWFVKSLIRANPMRLFVGSPLYCWYLRALGAKVGRRVAIFSGSVPVCTDLLAIGDGTVIRKDCSFSGYRAHAGRIQTGAVTLGRDVLVGEMTVLDIEASMGDGATLGHASSLHPYQVVPAGQTWHGSPAQPADADYRTLAPATCGTLRRAAYSTMQLVNRLVLAGPLAIAVAVAVLPRLPLLDDALGAASLPFTAWSYYREVGGLTFALFFGAVLLGLAVVTTLPRLANLALVPDRVYPLYGFRYWVQRTVARMTNLRFFTFLFGDSSAIVHYLRAIGYDLSRVEQTGSNFGMAVKHETPFLASVGTGTMVSDGLSLLNADFSSSSFRVARAAVGPRSFLGNNIAYPAGGRTGDNVLLATKVMVPVSGQVREGVGLLGSPPFEIPRSVERDATFDELKQGDELRRRLAGKNRHNAVTVALYLLVRWLYLYGAALVTLPAADLMDRLGPPAVAAAVCLLTVYSVAYFVLVERLVTGFRAVAPRFCSIYDRAFWAHERYWKVPAMAYVQAFNGTPFKSLIWRLLGVRLGRRVFDDGCWMTERTLVAVGDDCTLNALSTLQSHSLEDGTFKSDHITIGAGCTVGVNAFVHYGVTMGDGAVLEADAFLMKGEELAPGACWQGNPASERRPGSPEPAFPHPAGGARPGKAGLPAGGARAGRRAGRAGAVRAGWEAGLPAGLAGLPVATASPYGLVGVARPAGLARDPAPPYVGRDADQPLDRALAEARFVLVVGEAGAGASRTAFEAVRRRFPASRLLVPVGGAGAAAALLRDPPPATTAPPPVLWLDGLHRFLGDPGGFDRALLGWLRRPGGLVVVATIDAHRRDRLGRLRGGIGWAARRVLELAAEVPVPARLSPAELAGAQRRYPEMDLDRGIGRALTATAALERRYQAADPVVRALVQAAVDWRRTGATVPISEADLGELARAYLPDLDPPAGRPDGAGGLAWACEAVASGVALLRRTGHRWPRRFAAAGHLVALADGAAGGPAREVHPAAWALATARAAPRDAARIGFAAYAGGNLEAAAAAWALAAASGHPLLAPEAAVALGLLRRHLGDPEGAAAFEAAAASGHAAASRRAQVKLAGDR